MTEHRRNVHLYISVQFGAGYMSQEGFSLEYSRFVSVLLILTPVLDAGIYCIVNRLLWYISYYGKNLIHRFHDKFSFLIFKNRLIPSVLSGLLVLLFAPLIVQWVYQKILKYDYMQLLCVV